MNVCMHCVYNYICMYVFVCIVCEDIVCMLGHWSVSQEDVYKDQHALNIEVDRRGNETQRNKGHENHL